MNCDTCREALSARMDAEVGAGVDRQPDQVAATAHLATCQPCQDWQEAAMRVTRLARIGLALPSPGVPESVLDAAPGPRTARIASALRIALGLIGAAQLLVAVAQVATSVVSAGAMGAMTAGSMDGATPDHLLHESAAWNIGVGAAFLLIAGRFARPANVVGILTAFVAALTVLSAGDLISGAVTWGRVASHLLLIAGYLIVLTLARPSIRIHEPPGSGLNWRRWRLSPAGAGDGSTLDGSARSAAGGPALDASALGASALGVSALGGSALERPLPSSDRMSRTADAASWLVPSATPVSNATHVGRTVGGGMIGGEATGGPPSGAEDGSADPAVMSSGLAHRTGSSASAVASPTNAARRAA